MSLYHKFSIFFYSTFGPPWPLNYWASKGQVPKKSSEEHGVANLPNMINQDKNFQ